MIGGSSSNNFMIYSQIFASDYNKWSETTGCKNWNWDSVNDYFFQIEENSVKPTKSTELGKLWNQAWKNDSLKVQEEYMQFFIKNGLRWDSSKEHLFIASKRPNVYIFSETYVKRILFHEVEGLERAYGIEIKNRNVVKNIYVNKDVILSGGALQNVRILKKSFTESQLNNKNWASIGKKIKDHIFVPLFFEIKNPQIFGYSTSISSMLESFFSYLFYSKSFLAQTMIDGGQIYLDTNLNNTNWTLIQFTPNIQIALISSLIDAISLDNIFSKYLDPVGLNIFKKMVSKAETKNGFSIFIVLVQPLSEGTIDYTTTFEIDPNYLTNNEDIISLLLALNRVLNLIKESKVFKDMNIKLLKPHDDENEFVKTCYLDNMDEIDIGTKDINEQEFNKKYWVCYIKQVSYSIFHFHGTVRFGNENVTDYPLDCNLKLRNTTNVHVVDASVIPYPVAGGLQGVVTMIAEKFSKEFRFNSNEHN
jgi:choline dehydrogenase-like flavoprotein